VLTRGSCQAKRKKVARGGQRAQSEKGHIVMREARQKGGLCLAGKKEGRAFARSAWNNEERIIRKEVGGRGG